MPKEMTIEDWKKRYDSAQESMRELAAKLAVAEAIINNFEPEKKQWVQRLAMQDTIVQHQLGNSDNVVSKLQDEIIKLKALLKENNIDFED